MRTVSPFFSNHSKNVLVLPLCLADVRVLLSHKRKSKENKDEKHAAGLSGLTYFSSNALAAFFFLTSSLYSSCSVIVHSHASRESVCLVLLGSGQRKTQS